MATAPRRRQGTRQGDEQPTPVPQDTPNRPARSEGRAPVGQCIVTTYHHGDPFTPSRVRVDRADPRIRISADLLQDISVATVRDEPRAGDLYGDVLTIRGENRTVIYRVDFTDWDGADDSYAAEWPD